jgi:P-type conjugative transfer protein TrbG
MRVMTIILSIFFWAGLIQANPAEVIAKAHNNASDQPKSQQFLNAAMVFEWEQNRVYQIYTKPGRITDISLEPQEALISVAGGDSQRWTITESTSGKDAFLKRHIFVKPHQLGISNNLIITTDRRVYHIELHSLESVPYQAAISWNYPKSSLIIANELPSHEFKKPVTPMSGLAHMQLNFNYHFVTRDRPSWMPRRVFDDGHKTYIEFPLSMQDSEAPILWGLSKAKEQEVLNYRRYKNFYILDHLIELLELTAGGTAKIIVGIERDGI